MMDHTIPKPPVTSGYPLHRMVSELTKGEPALFSDQGEHLLIRTALPITSTAKPLRTLNTGDITVFELKACVATRTGGKNFYPDRHDWQARRAWLEKQGLKDGFEVMAAHVTGDRLQIQAAGGRRFWIDASHFTGVLKVTDASTFAKTLTQGIGRVGKAFGMGLLII